MTLVHLVSMERRGWAGVAFDTGKDIMITRQGERWEIVAISSVGGWWWSEGVVRTDKSYPYSLREKEKRNTRFYMPEVCFGIFLLSSLLLSCYCFQANATLQ